ncbi:MAG: hypothetical protein ABH956_00290 [Candidatus Nealsonbacteria bacterium]
MLSLSELIDLFAGKFVRISHTGRHIKTFEGICRTIIATPKGMGPFDIQLEDGHRFGFIPEVVTVDSVEGDLPACNSGRRKIQLI